MRSMGHVNRTAPAGDSCVRQEVVRRLRDQLATGDYHPPVEELVDRLVSLVIARQTGKRAGSGE
jgi:hypothetical protein